MIYEVIETENYPTMIKGTDESGQVYWIPLDPANSDYQRYLNPEAEHFTPIVTADE
jgi:hypothetical protein